VTVLRRLFVSESEFYKEYNLLKSMGRDTSNTFASIAVGYPYKSIIRVTYDDMYEILKTRKTGGFSLHIKNQLNKFKEQIDKLPLPEQLHSITTLNKIFVAVNMSMQATNTIINDQVLNLLGLDLF